MSIQEMTPEVPTATLFQQQAEEDESEEMSVDDIILRASEKNLASDMSDEELGSLGAKVITEMEYDEESRSAWLERNQDAMALAMQVAEKKTHPWINASNVIFPLITTAAVQFASRAYPAIVVGRNVTKGVVVGRDDGIPRMGEDGTPEVEMEMDPQTGQPVVNPQTGQPMPKATPDGQPVFVWEEEPGSKRERAERIGEHMSWQLLDEMSSWEEDTDKLCHILPIVGCCFRKTYFDPELGQNVSDLLLAENLVVNYWAKSLERAPRASERIKKYPSEILEMERMDLWITKEGGYGAATDHSEKDITAEQDAKTSQDPDAPHEFIEQHRREDLDGDGYPEPVIVTVHRDTQRVVRIVAGYEAEGIKTNPAGDKIVAIQPIQYYTKFGFIPNPQGAFYDVGFGELMKPINEAVNTAINQLIDAGTLANTKSGFIGRGLSMHSGEVKWKQGSFKVVNAPGARIRDAIVQMDFGEPSQVLFSLLGLLVDSAKEIGSIKDVLTGETSAAGMSPTTLMGLIDQGLQVFTGIYKRMHRSLKRELEKLYRLNRIYLEDGEGYQLGEEWREISREDYRKSPGVVPISDPSQVSKMQKLARAELLRTFIGDPHMNQKEIRQRIVDAVEIPEPETLILEQQPPDPAMQQMQQTLQMEAMKTRSEEIKNYAQSMNYLAQALKNASEADSSQIRGQLDILQMRMEMLNGASQKQSPSGAEPPPPEADAPAPEGEPPVPGARQAKDGNWYVDDPDRPGKYMMVA